MSTARRRVRTRRGTACAAADVAGSPLPGFRGGSDGGGSSEAPGLMEYEDPCA